MSHFAIGHPAREPAFYGRERTIRSLEVATWAWLCGQRRLGKTSLLLLCEERARKRGELAFHLDLAPLDPREDLFEAFCDWQEADAQDDILEALETADAAGLRGRPPHVAFRTLVRRLQRSGRTVTFLWDEAEALIDFEEQQPGLLRQLRGGLHGLRDFRFIISGTQLLSELFDLEQEDGLSSFVPTFTWVPIGGLDVVAARDLLCTQNTGGWRTKPNAEVLARALTWCGGHPLLLQEVGSRLFTWSRGRGDAIDTVEVDRAIAQVAASGTIRRIFEDDYRKLTGVQQILLRTLCETDRPIRLTDLVRQRALRLDELKIASTVLSAYGYLRGQDEVQLAFSFYRDLIPAPDTQRSVVAEAAVESAIRPTIFISYCHEDTEYLRALRTNLDVLQGTRTRTIWDDREIEAGADWSAEIDTAMGSSRLAVLLVSPDFLNSEFIRDHELPTLVRRARAGRCRLLFLHVRPSVANHIELEVDGRTFSPRDFQALNTPERPLAAMDAASREQCMVEVALKIAELGREGAPMPAAA